MAARAENTCLRCEGLDETHEFGCPVRKWIFGEYPKSFSYEYAMTQAILAINSGPTAIDKVLPEDDTEQLDRIMAVPSQ